VLSISLLAAAYAVESALSDRIVTIKGAAGSQKKSLGLVILGMILRGVRLWRREVIDLLLPLPLVGAYRALHAKTDLQDPMHFENS
jgi:hypothetical protein